MFSSIIPSSTTSSIKFAQSGAQKTYPSPPQPPNRFSVRVFKNPTAPFPYGPNPKYDVDYVPMPQPELQGANWYPSNHATSYSRPQPTSNYSIYPNPENGTYVYERSTCSKSDILSSSEYDSMSVTTSSPTSVFSPALSTDSTLTLRSPEISEIPLENQRTNRPATPAGPMYNSRGPPPPQTHSMARSASSHHMQQPPPLPADYRQRPQQAPSIPPMRVPVSSAGSAGAMAPHAVASAGFNGYSPEYAASTISEFEVEERDRIAKINAEYNSASTASFYAGSGSSNDGNTRRVSISPSNSSPSGQHSFNRVTASQPAHPNLQFSSRSQEFDTSHLSFQPYSSSSYDSPPKVERLPSQAPPEYPKAIPSMHQTSTTYSSPIGHDERNQEISYNGEPPRAQYRIAPSDSAINQSDNVSAPSSRSAHGTYASSAQDIVFIDPPQPPNFRLSDLPSQRGSVENHSPTALSHGSEGSSRTGSEANARRQSYVDPMRLQEDTLSDKLSDTGSLTRKGSSPRSTLQTSPRDQAGTGPELADRTPSPGRRDSYVAAPPKPAVDQRRSQFYPPDARDVYNSVRTASPVQIKSSPTELYNTTPHPPQPSVPPPRDTRTPSVENDMQSGRGRSRSTFFSASARPIFPEQVILGPYSSVPLPPESYVTPIYDVPRSADYEKAMLKARDAAARHYDAYDNGPPAYSSRYDSDRRYDSKPMMSGAYYTQSASSTSSRESDRSSKSNPRAGVPLPIPPVVSPTRESIPRNMVPFVIPSPSHPEPVRRLSDGDRAISSNPSYTRSNTPSPRNGTSMVPPNVPLPTQPFPEPQRRYSDGDQTMPALINPSGRNSAGLSRSVRWNDNLICPSPIFPSQRRKGWFNRRGDQLWTNDGVYKPPPAGFEYPADLADYPEHGDGWMNEEGIRIDLGHRLVPKTPKRSALKQTSLKP